jgi:hypothetical protein
MNRLPQMAVEISPCGYIARCYTADRVGIEGGPGAAAQYGNCQTARIYGRPSAERREFTLSGSVRVASSAVAMQATPMAIRISTVIIATVILLSSADRYNRLVFASEVLLLD